jgi:D-glycero-alpha-D-manno-heptose 1-phosphate guanylyltransferase
MGQLKVATKATPVIILAGGFGTRLRTVDATRPKPMVMAGGKPFLHWLLLHLTIQGFGDFILSTGYLAEQIEGHPWSREFSGSRFSFVRETAPLGTGGATLKAFKDLKLKEAWVLNGDTLVPSPLPERLDPTILATYTSLDPRHVYDAEPNIKTAGQTVTAIGTGGTHFDAGQVHVTSQALALYNGAIPCSLHQALEPAIKAEKVRCAPVEGLCYDIGTPERLRRFEKFLVDNKWV